MTIPSDGKGRRRQGPVLTAGSQVGKQSRQCFTAAFDSQPGGEAGSHPDDVRESRTPHRE